MTNLPDPTVEILERLMDAGGAKVDKLLADVLAVTKLPDDEEQDADDEVEHYERWD